MKLVAVVVVIVVVNYLSAVQVHGKLLGVGPRDERRACSAACRAWLIKRYDIDNFILMPIFNCSCDALFLLLSSAAPLCSLLRGFAQNLSPQSHLQSPAQSHPKFALLLGNLLMGANICYVSYSVFWPGLMRFWPDRQLPTERNIYCLHFVLGLLCSSAAKCLWLCTPLPPCSRLCLFVRLVVWPLPVASCCCYCLFSV